MGAMARQVLQVKRKNSTKCKPPDARLTVVGSVACRSGPREVAAGTAVDSSLGGAWAADSSVGAARVAVETATVGCSVAAAGGFVAEDSEAHAARRMAIKHRVGRNRVFIIFLRNGYSIHSLRNY